MLEKVETASRRSALPRFDYMPRTLLLLLGGAGVLIVGRGQPWSVWFLSLAALNFLVWPHLAYLRARHARDPRRAELNNLLCDAFTFGIWTAYLHFMLWLVFGFLAAIILSNLAAGGVRALSAALAGYLGGALGWGLVAGFHFQPVAGLTDELAGLCAGIGVLSLLGLVTYRQTGRLREAKRELQERNRVFESLLHMGLVTQGAGDIDGAIRRCLGYVRELLPQAGFGVVLYQVGAPGRIDHAEFLGVEDADRQRVRGELASLSARTAGSSSLPAANPAERLFLLPLGGHLREAAGVLVVRARRLTDRQRAVLQLFMDQLGAALQSSLLTAKLERLANTDPLTGVYNRVHFRAVLDEAIAARRASPPVEFALVLVDVNGLKQVNDAHGHDLGDALICAVARMLGGCIRETDVLVRLGGDEFVVLCRGCGERRAAELVERIRAAQRCTWADLEAHDGTALRLPVRVSLGFAASDRVDPEHLLQVADERMYRDKQAYYRGVGPAGRARPLSRG